MSQEMVKAPQEGQERAGEKFSRPRKLRLILWVCLVALFVAFLGFKVQERLSAAEADIKSLEEMEKPRQPVSTILLKPETWETRRSYYGQAKSAQTQEVTTFEREIVREVRVQVGDRVKVGQVLITLRTEDRSAKVQASRTGYDEAVRNYQRLSELQKKGGVSQSEVDRAYALVKSEEADLSSSRSTLQRTEIKASINGIVSARNVEPGEVAEVGRSLLSIVDPSNMEVELMVSKKDIASINKDTEVSIIVDGEAHAGQVKRSSPEAQSGSGLYPVIVGVEAGKNLLPGAYVEGSFLISRQENVIVIPSNVVQYRGEDQSVFVADGDVARQVPIETGEGRSGRVIITSGLKAGDELIVSGNRTLYDGVGIAKNIDFGEGKPQI